MRHVRTNADRDENKPPNIDDCLAHRCHEHREIPPVDDSEDSSGAECGICVGHKFVLLLEEKTEEHILELLFWPMIETARGRLNLLARGAGESFVDEARQRVDHYSRSRSESEGAHAETASSPRPESVQNTDPEDRDASAARSGT